MLSPFWTTLITNWLDYYWPALLLTKVFSRGAERNKTGPERAAEIDQGGFPLSRNCYAVRTHVVYARKFNRGNVLNVHIWEVARKRRYWARFNSKYTFMCDLPYIGSILFTHVKFTCVNVQRFLKIPAYPWWLVPTKQLQKTIYNKRKQIKK